MHINFRQPDDKYNATELIHLQQCEQCQEDLKTLEQLRHSTKTIPLSVPQEMNWQAIQNKVLDRYTPIDKQETKITRQLFYKQIIGVAASTFFIAVGWLVWNNYQLQNQLEQALVLNQKLELQIEYGLSLNFQQVHLLSEVDQIEMALINSVDVEDKVKLLQLRYKKLTKIIEKKEFPNEISI